MFTLGMCMIHLGLGPAKQGQLVSVYEPETQSISEAKLKEIMQGLKEHYSKSLIGLIEKMVSLDEMIRPDWIELSE